MTLLVPLLSLLLAGLAVLTGVMLVRRQLRGLQRDTAAQLEELRATQRAQHEAMEEQLTILRHDLREHLAIEFVVSNLLVDKGLIDEEEIQDTHRRLVLEPALLNEEHEALLEDLPEPEALRQRLVRNLPITLQ